MTTDRPQRGTAAAIIALVVGSALSWAVVLYLPVAAEWAIARFLSTGASEAAIETLFTVVLFGALLVVGVAGAALCGINALAPGRRPAVMLAFGAFVGLFGVTVTTGYSAMAGTLVVGPAHGVSPAMLGWGALVVLVQASAEEVYFRGWLQPAMARAWGVAPAILLAAIAFAGLHVAGGARSPLTLINLFLGGLLFGILAAYGRGITGAVAAHTLWNAAEQLLLGLDPNPGIGSFGSVFDFELVGATRWGGSSEGLNASFAMASTLFALLIPMVLLLRHRLTETVNQPAPPISRQAR